MFTPLHPLSSSLVCLTSPFLIYPALFLLLSPCVPAPSLTQGPCVPVCNISKAVRQPGQGKQPSTGFRGDGGRDVFPQEPRDPWRLLAGAREGPRGGRWSPKLPPKRTHTNQFIFFSLPVVIFCLLSLSSSSLCLWFSHSASLCVLCWHLCTQPFSSICFTHIQPFIITLIHTFIHSLFPKAFLCWNKEDMHMCVPLKFPEYVQYAAPGRSEIRKKISRLFQNASQLKWNKKSILTLCASGNIH